MGKLIVTNFPESLRARLEARARRNRRSVSDEVISIIQGEITGRTSSPTRPTKRRTPPLPPPIRLHGGLLTTDEIEAAINEGRD